MKLYSTQLSAIAKIHPIVLRWLNLHANRYCNDSSPACSVEGPLNIDTCLHDDAKFKTLVTIWPQSGVDVNLQPEYDAAANLLFETLREAKNDGFKEITLIPKVGGASDGD